MNYRVGRGRPPIATRFKPGHSGNPSGRPKAAPTLRSELIGELAQPAGVAGANVTKQRAIVRTLISSAMVGNLRAIGVLVSVLGRAPEPQDEPTEELTGHDQDILDALEQRERATANESEAPQAAGEGSATISSDRAPASPASRGQRQSRAAQRSDKA